jgi:hypothetical protein
MRTSLPALLLSLLVACGCAPKKATSGPDPTGTGTGTSAPVGTDPGTGTGTGSANGTTGDGDHPASGPSYGQTCAAGDVCAEGLKCVAYYGIAGANGPQFKTCEKTCATDNDCGAGMRCATIADGPGRVCR